jgi:hypothetical protein
MGRRRKLIWVAATTALVVGGALVRDPVGRTRPDLMAWFSFDDGLLTFSRSYRSAPAASPASDGRQLLVMPAVPPGKQEGASYPDDWLSFGAPTLAALRHINSGSRDGQGSEEVQQGSS